MVVKSWIQTYSLAYQRIYTSHRPHLTRNPQMILIDEDRDYVNEDHIHSFAKALLWDDQDDDQVSGNSTGYSLPTYKSAKQEADALGLQQLGQNAFALSPVTSPNSSGHSENGEVSNSTTSKLAASSLAKPSLIVSKNDWFPVGGPKPRRKKGKPSTSQRLSNEFRLLASYFFFRWPVLFFVVLWVLFLTTLYAVVRLYVALLEYFFTWTGQRKVLRNKLRASKTYEEWVANAIELDKFLGLDRWLDNPRFSYYDSQTVAKTMRKLKMLREKGDIADLMVYLQGCLKSNFAGIENRQLYSHRYYGTKKLVEQYIEEVVLCIDAVTAADANTVSPKQKRRFFRIVSKNYGKSALCLSGGACFAYTHFGLVKALLDNDLLPLIVSGTSGGGLIAALTCTRSDDELRKLLVPELAHKITACEDPWYVWLPRFWRTGARFDSVSWARKANYFTKGSNTFQEAYKITGRKLNISTVPAEPHSPVILCNTVTSPNCIIWSSLLASSAVPGILNPVVLMMKDPNTGEVIPFSMGNKWRDGSLRTDIPVDALNTYYNVNFSVVSQVNPHVSLFFFAPKGTVGRPVAIPRRKTRREKYASLRGGFFATAFEQLLKLEIKKWLQIVKTLDLLPRWLEQDWLNVFLQRFTGSITIWPRNRFKDFIYILLDPNEARMAEYLEKGQRSMFPRLLFVKHRLSIERAIERGRKATKSTASEAGLASSRSPSAGIGSDGDFMNGDGINIMGGIDQLGDNLLSESSDDEIKRKLAVSPFDVMYHDEDTDTDDDVDDDDGDDGNGDGEVNVDVDDDDENGVLNGNDDHYLSDPDQKVKFRRNTSLF